MKNTSSPFFLVGVVVLIGLGLMQMVNGNYIMTLLCGLAAAGLWWYKGRYESESLKMDTGKGVTKQQGQFVTDPAILAKIKEPQRDPSNMKVNNLTEGSLLEYDLQTWKADDMRVLYWTEGMEDGEHKVEKSIDLKSEDGSKKMTMRVMRDSDSDKVPITKDINVFQIDSRMNSYVSNGKFEPPTVLTFENEKYFRGGLRRGFNIDPGDNSYAVFESWDFQNQDKTKVLRVEHSGENKFSAQIGEYVNKYQFENLLPAPKSS